MGKFLEGIVDGMVAWKDFGKRVDRKFENYSSKDMKKAKSYDNGAFFGAATFFALAVGGIAWAGYWIINYQN